MSLRDDAELIIKNGIQDSLPNSAVAKALNSIEFLNGRIILVAIGKAAWQMAFSAYQSLGNKISDGIVITKYGHSRGPIANLEICEAGHPVPDENSFDATEKCIEKVKNLSVNDNVLLLLSGGGSSLFEMPLISKEESSDVTRKLLASGADIVKMNIIRKRLSKVKGGRFAIICKPAHIHTIVLSDIIGDPLDMIASGPAYPDSSTCETALALVKEFNLDFSDRVMDLLRKETPKSLDNVTTYVTGSVSELCKSASDTLKRLGYKSVFLTSSLSCIAREAGSFLASIAKDNSGTEESLAFIAGGETVVRLTGKGMGGRNQELALAAAQGISGLKDTAVFSFGSDGTDGPTDAAGGYVDSSSYEKLLSEGIDISEVLRNNDSYHALKAIDSLIVTGPTGTNVNDLAVVLIKR